MSDKPTDTPNRFADTAAMLRELFDWQDRLEDKRIEQLRKDTEEMLTDAQQVDVLRRNQTEGRSNEHFMERRRGK